MVFAWYDARRAYDAFHMAIKRSDEGTKTMDAPFIGTGIFGGAPNRGPDIPVYSEPSMRGPGGGRADVVRTGPGELVDFGDFWNAANNPYFVRPSDYIQTRNTVAAQQAAQQAAREQAAQVRIMPLLC